MAGLTIRTTVGFNDSGGGGRRRMRSWRWGGMGLLAYGTAAGCRASTRLEAWRHCLPFAPRCRRRHTLVTSPDDVDEAVEDTGWGDGCCVRGEGADGEDKGAAGDDCDDADEAEDDDEADDEEDEDDVVVGTDDADDGADVGAVDVDEVDAGGADVDAADDADDGDVDDGTGDEDGDVDDVCVEGEACCSVASCTGCSPPSPPNQSLGIGPIPEAMRSRSASAWWRMDAHSTACASSMGAHSSGSASR